MPESKSGALPLGDSPNFTPLNGTWDDTLTLLLKILSYLQEFVQKLFVQPLALKIPQKHKNLNHSWLLL